MNYNKSNKNDDIIVFAFAPNSQHIFKNINTAEFEYVFNVLSKLMNEHGVNLSKIGIGGFVEDVAAYISFIIRSYHLHNTINSVHISDFDPEEFDPEIEPIKFSHDQESDQSEQN